MAFDMKDYVEVADRIRAWYMDHEGGRIMTTIVEHTDARVVVRAEVYRNHIDPPAGVGHSALAIPGSTPYTKGSELENAETSAVGRALVMAGIPSKHVASAGEVASKRAESLVAPQQAQAAGRTRGSVTPPPERTGEDTSPEAGSQEGGPATGTCPKDSHLGPMSPLNPAGAALPAGRVMCVTCKTVVKEGT